MSTRRRETRTASQSRATGPSTEPSGHHHRSPANATTPSLVPARSAMFSELESYD
ncbi:hypothetical protein [Streptomyces sp. NPDC002671]